MDLFVLKDELKLREVEGGMIGEVDDYYFSFGEGKFGLINGTFITFTFTQSLNNSYLNKFMRKYRYGMLLKTFTRKNDSIAIFVPKKIKDMSDYIRKLRTLIETFRLNFLKQYKNCFICNDEADYVTEKADITVRNGFAAYIHKECVEKYNTYIERNDKVLNGEVSKIPFSIFMSIAGAFVGLIPNIISVLAFNLFVGYLFALIPLCSYYGYKIGGAPRKKYTTVFVITFSILSVCLMLYWFYSVLAFELGYNDIVHLLSFSENLSIFMKDAFISLAFIGLGISVAWKTITNSDSPKKI